jgi:hypothetical protein
MKKQFLIGLAFILCLTSSCDKEDEPAPAVIEVEDFTKTIDENPANGFVLGTLKASTDKGTLTFKLVNESVAGAFDLNTNTGELKVKDGAKFNYQANDKLTAKVSVVNGKVEKFINVNITIVLTDALIFNGQKIDLSNANIYWSYANAYSATHERHDIIITDGEFKGVNYTGNNAMDFPNGYTYRIILFIYPKVGTNYNVENEFVVSEYNSPSNLAKWNVGYVAILNSDFTLSTNNFSGNPKILFNYTIGENGFGLTGPFKIALPQSIDNENKSISIEINGQYKRIFDN